MGTLIMNRTNLVYWYISVSRERRILYSSVDCMDEHYGDGEKALPGLKKVKNDLKKAEEMDQNTLNHESLALPTSHQ